ncbi:3',5'-cyclic AMP phosphodiesterase CpdA [Abditibacterium utsteinense]|uniref:3',5'-cyclic AMP phosphodiesterase CpdA n=1 Tax=Abditibacterium utsteinense TaxID=1960156 RepID=A0A2S8SSV2_9BACT|nr:calcineurin-like phosphoesterase family protein [Abditibacterium utsteinense]PQV63856.1 3',5'-cyclic AMP phosphodiesterase CpdA [Abditibacterium utsteinense]
MNRREFTQNLLLATGALTLQPLQRLVQAQQNVAVPPLRNGETVAFASGTIYGVRGGKKSPLPQVRVSNGREVVSTDRLGRYRLPVADGDIIFLCKPRDYALPLNADNLPQFYRIHQPQGSPQQKFAGIAPTGILPTSLDWTLQSQPESDEFRVLLFGDPQSRNQEEIGFLTRDILADVAGEKAAFGVSLGDQAFDDLTVYPNQNRAIAMLGMPWFNLKGNHDMNYDAPNRAESGETFKATFGPTYHSFDYGAAHFIVLDNVAYEGKTDALPDNGKPDPRTLDGKRRGAYHTELGERQLQWLENDLKLVPRDQLVVLMMHIPLVAVGDNREADLRELPGFFRLVENRPNCLSISAHTHIQQHRFLGREVGFNGQNSHHHFNSVTTCGSWWGGMRDESGIPHATMSDGAPNGYSFLNIKGSTYSLDFKVARRAADYQMNLYAPVEVARAELDKSEIVANIFAGSPKSKVEMQIGNGNWTAMQLAPRPDPLYVAAKAAQETLPKTAGRKLPETGVSPHIWAAKLPADLTPGAHIVRVRTTDMWNRTHQDRAIVRVV